MKIELEYPYSADWRFGYLRVSKGGRRLLDLVNDKSDRTTVSYARYLKSVEIGKYIPNGYEVDHINTDCTDDDLQNLQILTREDHLRKSALELSTGRTGNHLECPYCKNLFFIEARNMKNKKNMFCNQSCNARYSYEILKIKNFIVGSNKIEVTKDLEDFIKTSRQEGRSDYWIAERIPLSRCKINRFRKENNIP